MTTGAENTVPGTIPPPRSSAAALELDGLTAGYGRTTVLRDIDIRVAAGSVTALLGPNGAGKTTLLRVAAGLLTPTRGRVMISGEAYTKRSPHDRARGGLCLIPEGRGIFPNLTVRENLRLQVPPWLTDNGYDAALEAFPILSDRLGQRAASLSGGQQQMLALSRCLLSEPNIVLLDEVSMGLAPRVVEVIFEALDNLAQRGMALLLVEQYVARALQLADHVCLLDRGAIVFSRPADQVDAEILTGSYLGNSNV